MQADVRDLAKSTLDQQGKVTRFPNNLPSHHWMQLFLKRNSGINRRVATNIKRNRAAVSKEVIDEYFDNVEIVLKDVPASNIVNYDETCFRDDPGVKKLLFKRGCKYPERILNTTKQTTSVMFAGAASGELLPPFVVFKAENLYKSWCKEGPMQACYDVSKSGWYDSYLWKVVS